MARNITGNSSGDELQGSDVYDSLSFLIVSAWFTASTLTLGSDAARDLWCLIIKSRDAAASVGDSSWRIWADLRTGEDKLHFTVSSGSAKNDATITSLSSKISVDTWYSVVGAWDGTNQDIWLSTGDTAAAASVVATMGATNAFPLTIGGRADATAGREWRGDVAEMAVYTSGTYPTVGDVAAFYKFSPIIARANGLASYWPLIGRASPEPDRVGGIDLTLAGTPDWAPHPPIIYPDPQFIVTPPSAIDIAANINIAPSGNYVQVV